MILIRDTRSHYYFAHVKTLVEQLVALLVLELDPEENDENSLTIFTALQCGHLTSSLPSLDIRNSSNFTPHS